MNCIIWLLQLGESVFGDRHQFMQPQAADALADFFCNLCTNKRICCRNQKQSQCHQSTQFHITTSWNQYTGRLLLGSKRKLKDLFQNSEQSQCYQSTQFHVTTSCRCTGRLLLGPMRKQKDLLQNSEQSQCHHCKIC